MNENKESQRGKLKTSSKKLTFCEYDSECFYQLGKSYSSYIDKKVVNWFKKTKHICCGSTFRFATPEDIPNLRSMNRNYSKYNKASYYEELLSLRNQFLLVVERTNLEGKQTLVGMIHYAFEEYRTKLRCETDVIGGYQEKEKEKSEIAKNTVRISMLRLIHKKKTGRILKCVGIESEPDTLMVMLSLLCEHGRREGMKWLLLVSPRSKVQYFQQIFGMKVTENPNMKKILMELDISQFDYRNLYDKQANVDKSHMSKNPSIFEESIASGCKTIFDSDICDRNSQNSEKEMGEMSNYLGRNESVDRSRSKSRETSKKSGKGRNRNRSRSRSRNGNRSRSRNDNTRKIRINI